MTVVSGNVRDDILNLEQIPPLSLIANELLRAVGDPDLDAKQLAAILEKDAGLTSRIIGLANSAFFGQSTPVLSMEQAIIRVLGLDMVRSLGLSMALAGSFDGSRCPSFDLRQYWLLALGTAALSKDLSLALGHPEVVHPDAAYLCGLLHTLGELALVHLRPDLMCDAIHAHQDDADLDMSELQRIHLGVDQWQAGEWLAFRWHLPEQVQHSIGYFGKRDYQGPHLSLAQVVAFARSWLLAHLADEPQMTDAPELLTAVYPDVAERFQECLDELKALAAGMA